MTPHCYATVNKHQSICRPLALISPSRLLRSFRLLVPLFCALFLTALSGSVHAQVVASFIVDDTAGCAPLLVNFHNTSTGATTYNWDLGNGTLSGLSDVSGSYLTAGTYTVTLVAHNGPASSTFTTVIRVYSPPTVNFTATDTSICPYGSTTFISTSTPGSWGTLTYNWNFGDGYTSAAIAPSHAYAAPGYYNVTLFATNAKGCVNSLSRPSYVHVLTPAAISFNAPVASFCKPPATVSFLNTTTGTAPITYNWNFGDGGTSTAPAPNHIYTSSGSFPVRLVATDGKGCKDTLTVNNYITVGSLSASFTAVPTACGGAPVTFNNTSSTHISSQWFFGDGGTSSADVGVHVYTANGTYTVKLVVFDGTCYDTVTHPISISLPTGSLARTPAFPCPPPQALTFTGTVPPGTSVSWIFSDGSTGAGPSVTHTYTAPSIYTTSMILTNGSGCKDTISRLDTLFDLNLNPSASVGDGCIPLTNSFTAYAYSVVYNPFTLSPMFLSYPYPITSYTWNFGDGSPTSSSSSPTHTYTAVGTYTLACHVTTTGGCSATNSATVIKAGSEQTALFTSSPRRLCAGRMFNFHSTSTSTLLIDKYNWSYSDGGGDHGMILNPTHSYSAPGIYNVSLSVEYNGCSSHAFSIPDTVDSPGAVIHYAFDCSPANGVTFGDSSIGDNSHLWIFGDGFTSTLDNIDHMYPSLSSYSVKLATYNSVTGCRDTGRVTLNLAKPSISFVISDSMLCKNQSDTINSAVTVRTASQNYWYDNGILKDSVNSMLVDTFLVRGAHNIVLVIKDNYGCLDTSRTVHVLAGDPIDSFSLTPATGCGPLNVSFTDHTTDVVGASLSSYFWTFGDGTPGAYGPAATAHVYTNPGSYTVTQIVTDNIGCMDTFSSATHVLVHRPVATFSVSPSVVCAGTAVHFTNTSTATTGCLWLFGDGATSTLSNPLHAYPSSGSYTVRLVVYDAFGCSSDTLVMPSMITVNFSPSASFTQSDSFAVCPPLNVNFFNTSTGAASYYWMFGDGTSSLATSPSDVYISSGLYDVKLVAIASNGCTDTETHHVSIFGYPGAFSYTPVSGCSPLTVNFTSSAIGVFNFNWDFADGITFSGAGASSISHTYAYSGRYLPKLILTDSAGCISFSTGADTIRADTVSADFSMTPNPACQNAPITFHDLSTSGTFLAMTGWSWSFGSGATSTLSAPTYTYSTSGTKTITLTVTDASGCTGTVTHTVTVNAATPPISGTSPICQGTTASFTDALPGGTWSSSNSAVASIGSVSGIVSGITAGTATITYTSGPGCPATKPVTVNTSPAAIVGASGLCIATTSSFTDPTPGGVWSITPATVASVSPTGAVTGIGAGTATLSYTVAGCSATKSVTISAAPSPISGSGTVCVGATVTLGDLIPGGTWSSTSPLVAVGSSAGTVTGITAGTTAIITYSLGFGCTVTRPITVNVSSTVSGPSGVCIGGIIGLTTTGTGGTWSSTVPSVATVGSATGIVTGITPGITTINYTLPGGCAAGHIVTVNGLPSPIGGTLHVCRYGSTTLTDTAGGGLWTIAPATIATIGSTSGIVTGVAAGTAVVTYSLGSTGCQKIATVTVDPSSAPIAGPSHVCLGATIHLTDASPGGTWSGGTPTVSVGSATGIVTGLSVGTTAVVTYAVPATACASTYAVTVDPLPSPITGPATVCIGLTAALSDADAGGTWSSSNTVIAPVGSASGIVSGGASGSAIITYTLPTGCTTTATITVNSSPAIITGTTHVCVGGSSILSDASPGGTWSVSNSSASINPSSGLVTGLLPGIDTITYALGPSCAQTAIFTVNAFPGSITGLNHVCLGSSVTLSDIPSGGTWSSSNPLVAVAGSATGVITGVSAGPATITYSTGLGCNAAYPIIVNPLPSGIMGNPYVCIGATTPLSNFTPGGVWSSANPSVASISSTGVVTGSTGGGTTISYTISSGCAATLSMSVIVVPAITPITNKCAWGDTLNVTDAAVPGVFVSSLVTVDNLGGGNGRVITHAPGVATISYILPMGCSVTSVLTINPLPAIIDGNQHLCVGLSTSLTDATPGGVWSSPGYSGTVMVNATSGLVTGVAAGTALITYTLPVTGCFVDTTVTVSLPPVAVSGVDALCVGASSVFSDATPGGYWTSSNTAVAAVGSASGSVTGLSAGVATISYIQGAACFAARSVTINPLPAIFNVVGGGSFCAGGSGVHVYLGGSQTGVDYQLYFGTTAVGAPLHGTGSSLDFGLQLALGSYSVVATNPVTLCSATMSGSVSVGMYPAPNDFILTGGGPYCAGGTGTHIGLAGSSTGINYRLYRGTTPVGIPVAGTGSLLDFGLYTTSGTYTVLASNVSTGCTAVMSSSVTVTITPTVTPDVTISVTPNDTVCAGTAITFSASPVNGGTTPVYLWKVNGTGGTTGASYTYAPANGDVIAVRLTSNATCALPDTVTRSVAVVVDPQLIPVVTITAFPGVLLVPGQYDTLVASAANAGTTPAYQWYLNGVLLPGETSDTLIRHNFNNNDVLRCQVTSAGNCGGQTGSNSITITINTVEVQQINSTGNLVVQPNPNKGEFTIRGTIGSTIDEAVSVELTDMLGQVVYKQSVIAHAGNVDERLHPAALANGVYLLSVRAASFSRVFHIIIER